MNKLRSLIGKKEQPEPSTESKERVCLNPLDHENGTLMADGSPIPVWLSDRLSSSTTSCQTCQFDSPTSAYVFTSNGWLYKTDLDQAAADYPCAGIDASGQLTSVKLKKYLKILVAVLALIGLYSLFKGDKTKSGYSRRGTPSRAKYPHKSIEWYSDDEQEEED